MSSFIICIEFYVEDAYSWLFYCWLLTIKWSILCLYSDDLQNLMLRKISKAVNATAITKYTRIGWNYEASSVPYINVKIERTTIMKRPATAVPIVYFDTTY